MMLFGNSVQATQYAMRRIGYTLKEDVPIDTQVFLDLEGAIERTSKTASQWKTGTEPLLSPGASSDQRGASI